MPARRLLTLLVCLLMAWGLAPGGPQAPADRAPLQKLDPFLRRIAQGVERRQGTIAARLLPLSREVIATLPPFVRARPDDVAPEDSILYVKARLAAGEDDRHEDALAERLRAIGVELRGRTPGIASLAVPAAALGALAALPEVLWIKVSRSYRLMNEISTGDTYTGARTENAVFGNTGEGVIVAVIDTGIDWRHADFRDQDNTTRILGIWDQTLSDGAHPPPAGFPFGAFYSQAVIDQALAQGTSLLTADGHGHGTHVAGTAAGNGRHTGNGVPVGTFAGVAPAAELLVVRVFDSAGDFCDACDLTAAVDFIDGFAKAAGKPWVGNMSLGDPVGGAHDGTSPDELAIDALVGPGRPGTQIAVAAGNEGSAARHSHWGGTLQAGFTYENTFLLDSASPTGGSDNDFVWIDLWYEGTDNVTVEIVTPGNQTVSAARGADSGIECTPSGAVQIDATNAPDPENGDNQVVIEISDSPACSPVTSPASGTWTIRMIINSVGGASSGAFDLWNAAETPRAAGAGDYVNFSAFSPGTMISIPGTSLHALTAGSFVGKNSWITADQSVFTATTTAPVGAISSFSSTGPTRDGRVKPDVAAPGEFVASSRGSGISFNQQFVERDGVHANLRGTSMATPHVAGTAALLFGIDPALDGGQVKAAVQRAARSDQQTGAVPNYFFGVGKLRTLDAAYEAASMTTGMGAAGSSVSFTWPGHEEMDSWNVYRSALPGITSSNYGACFRNGLPSPNFNDLQVPTRGTGFLYLVTGVYTSPTTFLEVEGSLGTDSAGRIRPNNFPCP